MIAEAIRFLFSNIPSIMFAAAIIIAALTKHPAGRAERYLAWLLLFQSE